MLLQYIMLIPTSNFLSVEADKKTGDALNSIKIDFSRMVFTSRSSQGFTECVSCKALLIQEDSKHQYASEKECFTWVCRFCKKQNSSKQLHFARTNSKWAIQKNLKSKITPPIMLFVIDNSGSMSQSIFSNIKFSSNPHVIAEAKKSLNYKFSEILNQSKLYEMEKKELQRIQASFTNVVKSTKYSQEQISKLTFLYAMIEYNLKNLVKKESIKDCRVGFIFFSDMIYVLKGAKQKEVPVYVQQGQLCHEEWPYRKEPADFYDYDCLFKKGKGYDKYFGDSRLKSIDISKVAINRVKGGGRTALGPALALAMGIVSVHDQGSRVIVVTDSMPNFGLLTTGDSDYVYKKIGTCLQQNGATLSILKWSGDQLGKTKEQESFVDFRNVFREHVQQIQLNLAKCKQNEGLEISMTTLNNLINRQPTGMSVQIALHCDNPKIVPQRLAFDFSDYKTLRFLSSNSKSWCTLSIGSLLQYDYLFPVTTQIVIRYSDIFTRQRYLFMSYTRQHLQRPKVLKPPGEGQTSDTFLQSQEQTLNLDNLQQLCSLQLLSKYQTQRRDEPQSQQDQLRSVFRYKQIQLDRQLHNPNDIAVLQNFLHHETFESSPYSQDQQQL